MSKVSKVPTPGPWLPLTSVRLKNFKAITDATFDIRPLNIILGSNSAGKSSLLQALVLASQNFRSGTTYSFDLNNQYLTLGPFGDLMRRGANRSENLTMEFVFSKKNAEGVIDHTYSTRVELDSRRKNNHKSSVPVTKFQISENFSGNQTQLIVSLPMGDTSAAASLRGTYFSHERDFQHKNVRFSHHEKPSQAPWQISAIFTPNQDDRFLPMMLVDRSIYLNEEIRKGLLERFISGPWSQSLKTSRTVSRLPETKEAYRNAIKAISRPKMISETELVSLDKWFEGFSSGKLFSVEAMRQFLKQETDDDSRSDFFVALKGVSPEAFASFLSQESRLPGSFLKTVVPQILPITGMDQADHYYSALRYYFRQLGQIANRLQYLGPLRAHSLTEQKNNAPSYPWAPIGARGELLAYQLGLEKNNRDSEYPVPVRKGKSVVFNVERITLLEALGRWVQWFDLGDNLLPKDEGVWGSYLELDGEKFHQKGTGISQVIPVLTICLMASKGALTLIEQPELHLHPAMQQKLGTFFSEISKSGRRLVVETHSEYILTRIRKEIATKNLDNASVGLTFVSASRGRDGLSKSKYEQVEISPTGAIAKWPQAFYDFTADDKMAIFEATMDAG